MATKDRLDIVIFGATGFTGKYAIEEILKLEKEQENLSWGVAGRNEAKLKNVLDAVSKKTGKVLSRTEIIIADVSDEESLVRMAMRARVIVNCCGPYRQFGEPLVKASIAGGAHHVDVSGEPLYMEEMQLKYHKAAEEKGVYIISACGFDSIPTDLGTVFLMKNFEGDLNSAETYVQLWLADGIKGSGLHHGTWESAVHGYNEMGKWKSLHQKLFPNELPKLIPKRRLRGPIHKTEYVQGWCLPFPGSDESVMERTQRYFYEEQNKRPVQIHAYIAFKSCLTILRLMFFLTIFAILGKFECGRRLLLKYPGVFSSGLVKSEGPSEESIQNTHFSVTIVGEGWKEKRADPIAEHSNNPDKRMVVKVSGTNPAYGSTNKCLLLSAITCLREADKMPGKGGVLTPGVAFAETSLIEELDKHNVKFEIISTKNI